MDDVGEREVLARGLPPKINDATPLFIVFNAASGSGDKHASLAAIESVLRNSARRFHLFKAGVAGEISRCAQAAVREAVKHNGAVVAAGGDGTINAVATEVLPTGCPMGFIPQGTFNYSGRAHSIPLDPVAATEALLHARIKPVQVGKVNDRLFLVNASLGLYPQLFEDREALKKQYGRRRIVALLGGLSTLLSYRHQFLLEIEHDGQQERVRTPTLFVGNNALQLEQVGLPEVDDVKQRRLAAVIVRPVSGPAMLWLALQGALGRLHEANNVRDFAFATMIVKPAGRSQGALKLATDGEVCWMRPPLRFHVAAQKLQLMVPADAPK